MANTRLRRVLSQVAVVLRAERHRIDRARRGPAHWSEAKYTSIESPVLIAGAGRSGTTLLSAMLNAHSQLYCGPEYDLVTRTDLSAADVARNVGLDEETIRVLIERSENRWQFVEQVIRATKQAKGITRLATKSPLYTFVAHDIFSTFPNAQILYIYRDGRDVAVSMRKYASNIRVRYDATYSEGGLLSIEYCADTWRTFINAMRPYAEDSRCKLISYEQLVSAPTHTLQSVSAFLGLPFESDMLRFHETGTGGRQDLDAPHLAGVKQPLYTDRPGGWRNVLSPDDVYIFEQHAGAELRRLGYELECASLDGPAA